MKFTEYMNEKKSFFEEMKGECKYALRHRALNAYGKKPKELSPEEMKNILNALLREFGGLIPTGTTEEFKTMFKTTFAKEIKFAKGN